MGVLDESEGERGTVTFWPGGAAGDKGPDKFWPGGPTQAKAGYFGSAAGGWDDGPAAADEGRCLSERDGDGDGYDTYYGGYVAFSGSDSADYYGHGPMDVDAGDTGGSAGEQAELFADSTGFYCAGEYPAGGSYYGPAAALVAEDDVGGGWYEAGFGGEAAGAALAFSRGDCTYYHLGTYPRVGWADGGEGPGRGPPGAAGHGSGGSDGDGEAGDGESGDEVRCPQPEPEFDGSCRGALLLLYRRLSV